MGATAVRRMGVCTLGLALCLAIGCGGPGITKANFEKIKMNESTKADVDKLMGVEGTELKADEAKKIIESSPQFKMMGGGGFPGGGFPGGGFPGALDPTKVEGYDKMTEEEKKDLKEQ